jgi:hypothetical protein
MAEPLFIIKTEWDGRVIVEAVEPYQMLVTAGPNPEMLLPGCNKSITRDELLAFVERMNAN